MRRLILTIPVGLALLLPVGASATPAHMACARALIAHQSKCLAIKQYCTHAYDSQYRRYGLRCISRDRNNRYRLTQA